PGWQSEHAWAKVSLLIVAAVLPCFGFFKLAHDFEMRLLIKRGQIRLAERLDDRRTRIKEDYKRLDLDRQYATLLENRIQESGEEPLDVYAWPFFNTTIEPVSPEPHGTEEKDLFDNRLQWALAAFRPLYNYVAVETHGLIASSLKDRSLQWSSGSENELVYTEFANDTGNTRRICSVWKPLSLSWGPWWWLGVVVAIVGLFLFVRFVAAWIYPVSLRESPVRTDPPELARNICTNSS